MMQNNGFSPVGMRVDALSVQRGDVELFSDISVALEPGQALVLKGPNGAGKSSALMALAGHIEKKSGQIQWPGIDPEIEPGTHIHFLGHLSAVQRGLSVLENLRFWTASYGGDPAGVPDALSASGLGALGDLSCSVLSAGQTRRLALARLIATPRPVWLLDEPTGALDEKGVRWVDRLIAGHLEKSGIAVIATHLPLAIEADPRVQLLSLGEQV